MMYSKKERPIRKVGHKLHNTMEMFKDRYSNTDKYQQILNLDQTLDNMILTFNDLYLKIIKRQALIEEQIAKEEFHGDLHEQYHQNNIEINNDFDSLFQKIKTTLNWLTIFWVNFLDRSDTRGIENGSFGKCLNSINDKKDGSKKFKKIRNLYLTYGKKLEDNANFYRDKFIEHVAREKTLKSSSLSSGYGELIKQHYSINHETSNLEEDKNTNCPDSHPPKFLKMVHQYTDVTFYEYHVHYCPSKECVVGAKARMGQPLGYICDGNSGHFKKYGSHAHVFFSPNYPKDLHEKHGEENMPEMSSSPDPIGSFLLCLQFSQKTLRAVLD